MAFTVRFEGLICHVGTSADPNNKLHAALVSDVPTHTPEMVVDGGPPWTLNLGDTIRFSSGAGKARATPAFQARVPGLKELLPPGHTIDSTILTATHNGGANGVLSYAIFPDGSLDASELSFHPLDFDGTDGIFIKKMCVARGVVFTSDADAIEVFVENGTTIVHRAPLLPGSQVEISNTSSTTTGHFHLYSEITTAPAIATAKADKSRKCTHFELTAATGSAFRTKEEGIAVAEKSAMDSVVHGARAGFGPFSVPHAECTNSNWP